MTNLRSKARIMIFSAAALLIATGYAFQFYRQARQYETALQASYLRAAEDLATYTENISTTLEKGRYTGTPEQLDRLTAKLWKEASAAKASLSQLPTSSFDLENTYKFLAQVGEYSISLSRKAADGDALTQEDTQNLKKLSDYADRLQENMLVIQDALRSGQMDFSDAPAKGAVPTIGEDLAEFEEGFTAYPTLIYDGPFSDHLLTREPEMLKTATDLGWESAREKAAHAFNIDPSLLSDSGEEQGRMPSYAFSFGEREISVTRKGGYLTYLTDPRIVTTSSLSAEEAARKAENYLNWLGIPDMTLTYYETAGNILTANFAAVENGFLLYPDLIKVSVAMDDGGIVGFDARGYLTCHKKRDLPSPILSQKEAEASLSPLLTVQSARLAVIPSDGELERNCYEFHCTAENGKELLVYVNCDTGKEEQILILLIDENGTLTI